MPSGPQFTCACCGRLTQAEAYGSFEICPVCFWQDDIVQIADPYYEDGANRSNLVEAQKVYKSIGASETRRLEFVEPPTEDQQIDPRWRPFDPARDTSSDETGPTFTPYWLKS